MPGNILGGGRDVLRRLLFGDPYPIGRLLEKRGLVSVFVVGSRIEDSRIERFAGEEAQLEHFLSLVDEGSVVWDIGANVGMFSVFSSRAGGDVTAFEPDPSFCGRLRQNVALNGQEVRVREVALSDENGEAALYSDGVSGISPGITIEEGEERGEVTVETIRADDVEVEPPDVVKLDVEGAEASVLRGMTETLRSASTVFVEVHPALLPRFGDDVEDVMESLESAGFGQELSIGRDEQTHYVFEK